MKRFVWSVCVVLTCALGCADPTAGDDQPVESGLKAGKGDCPTCDDAGPGAMVQAGISSRFYQRGDQWAVAYQFTERHDMNMGPVLKVAEEDLPVGEQVQSNRDRSPVFLFDYNVNHLSQQVFSTVGGGEVQRDVALIQVTAGDPSNTLVPELFSGEAPTQIQTRLEFELNDLLDPVSETIYSRNYPNGKRIRLSHKSRLQTGSSIFPHTVPRTLVQPGYIQGVEVELSPELEAVADALRPTWRSQVYFKYTFQEVGEADGYGDIVYWAKGELWPFYVRTDQGEGVLIGFEEANAQQVEGK